MDTSFVEELASAAPTPGGGGASAYCGALACALASMVGNLTVGKKTYAQVEPEVYMRLEKLADLRGRLLGLVGADAEAFGPLAAAYRMPKDTPEQIAAKQAAIQDTLHGATFMVLAPEHVLAKSLATDETREAVEKYIFDSSMKSNVDRMQDKEKTGVFTGSYAINPLNGKKVPIRVQR